MYIEHSNSYMKKIASVNYGGISRSSGTQLNTFEIKSCNLSVINTNPKSGQTVT